MAINGRTLRKNSRVKATFRELLEACPDAFVVADELGKIVFVNPQVEKMFGYTRQNLVGRKMEMLVPHLRQVHLEHRVPVSGRHGVTPMGKYLKLSGRHKDGHEFAVEVHFSPLQTENGLPILSSIRDIRYRLDMENDLQRAELDAQARAEELSAILDAAPGMTLIARDPACRVMTGGRVAYDLLRRPYGSNLSKSASEGEVPSNFRVYRNGRELSAKELPVQRAATTGREVRDSELTIVFANGDSRDFLGNAAPLLNDDGTVRGAVGVFVDITERKLAERSTRKLYAHMLRAQENERRRIARELHDSVGQNLTGLVLSLGALKRVSARLDQKSRKALAEGLVSAREAARDVRTLSRLLHPPLLHEFGLPDAIRTYVRGFSDRSGIKVDIQLPTRQRRLKKDIETTLFRVVQEALTNVYRHSGSKRAIIRMREADKQLVLEIRDFGRGMKASSAKRKLKSTKGVGVGIPGIQERLQHFDGELEVRSSKKGTLLRALLPLSRSNGEDHSRPSD
jgi:PAS domain S-box-containing protein